MATRPIHSIEAGLILIADGCDMTKGRARIPLEIPSKPTRGDIHKYSANAIEKVHIHRGEEHPLNNLLHFCEVDNVGIIGVFVANSLQKNDFIRCM